LPRQDDARLGPRIPLERTRILEAAIARADSEGIETLSMRRLAADLGVEAMTLYYHVTNKDDILDAIVDLVMAEIELPTPGEPWRAGLRRTAMSAHAAFLRHPWAAAFTLDPARLRPARLRYMDAILASLRGGGFTVEMTHHAYHALESHVVGFTLWVVGISSGIANLPDGGARLVAAIRPDELPHLAEHLHYHATVEENDEEGEFAYGLDLLLDGLEERLAREGTGDGAGIGA
jgi:AcrR family transcriptional regulator